MSWKTSHITINTTKYVGGIGHGVVNKSYEYDLGDGASVLQIMETIASADKKHPDATSMVIVLVKGEE